MIEWALSTLRDQGLVDDVRFAGLLTHDKRELEEWGNDRIRRILTARGVEPEVIEQALQTESPSDELERAVGVLRRRFPVPPEDPRGRERALGVLLRKGFDTELALDALAEHACGLSSDNLGQLRETHP